MTTLATCSVLEHGVAPALEVQYPDLHQLLAGGDVRSLLDVGCGGGWLSVAAERRYAMTVHGVDRDPGAIAVARAAAAKLGSRATFATTDLFALPAGDGWDVVTALGVVPHVADPRAALAALAAQLAPGPQARLYLVLAHRHARRPFLDYFAGLRTHGYDDDALLAAFAALHRGAVAPDHLRACFREQVLRTDERQQTLAEVAGWLAELGLVVESTSVNRFAPFRDLAVLFELEKALADVSFRRNVVQRRLYPGMFSVCARRRESASW